ncbi:MAG: DNA topoisomerase I [Campylobacteraceae bacterium 4484_166]|nr:MAG: DNA topoisomerase I [Campylobacteraceae bacterium 4484_166]
MKNLVIVESPAKARTISKFLSNDYLVMASMGHVRDLPKSTLGFDPENEFKPKYQISKDKSKIIKELKAKIDKDTVIYLAADEDREGEAIAWHLIPALKCEKNPIKRIVFHEITKSAVLEAIKNPREIDQNLVDAQQARRILDRAVGYKLSPLLWKKVRYGLSAGRVQSVAVRIIVDRENEIRAFKKEEFWKIKAKFTNPDFEALLVKIENKTIKITNEKDATNIRQACINGDFVLTQVEQNESKRNPSAPYTTSTLQQDASSKLGFSVKQTMVVAQKLYEGSINIPGHSGGLITYMRTDSLNLSNSATTMAKDLINDTFGDKYSLKTPRRYKSKSKGAQEAHEAIRPVNLFLKPKDVRDYLDGSQYRLYSLIWKRTVATQMSQAVVANTTYNIEVSNDKKYQFQAKGNKIIFDGFMKVYSFDKDSYQNNTESFLPVIKQGQILTCKDIENTQHFTKPPSRYTEASLVKKLESEGIGRPSTYAPTISTIQARDYVVKTDDKKLAPAPIGEVVNSFLMEHFKDIVDTGFTASVEESFDKIADGKIKWQSVLANFYHEFAKTIEDKEENAPRAKFNDAKLLGNDPKTNKQISASVGRFGPYVQLGKKDDKDENGKEIKPKFASIPKDISVDKITLEQALVLLQLPKVLGLDDDGNEIKVNVGRFGPYLQIKQEYFSIKEDDPYTITKNRAIEVIKALKEEKAKAIIKDFKDKETTLLYGKYGAYIKHKKKNYKLPKKLDESKLKALTYEEVEHIIKNQPKGGRVARKRK